MKKLYEAPAYELEKFAIQSVVTAIESVVTEVDPDDDFDF